MSDYILNVNVPLDDDRFMRRQCPYCNMQFKKYMPENESVAEETEDKTKDEMASELYCPYCGQTAAHDEWWTSEQVQYFKDVATQKVIEPTLDNFSKTVKNLGGDLLDIHVDASQKANPRILSEANDMRRCELMCCKISLKIEEDWKKQIYCILCGRANEI